MAKKDKAGSAELGPDEALLKEIRETYRDYAAKWRYNFDQGDEDMKALSVDGSWPAAEVAARKEAKRPIVHIDITSQYNGRVVNQARMNKRGIKVTATGSGADDKSAALREKRIRQIEYESRAPAARLTAFQNAVDRGIGHWKVAVKYKSPESFEQKIYIERIPNSKSVLIDPDCREADFSDAKRAFHFNRISKSEFLAEYKDAAIRSFSPEHMSVAKEWIGKDDLLLAEYWRVEKAKRRFIQIKGETSGRYVDELPPGVRATKTSVILPDGGEAPIWREKMAEASKVCQYITNGVEILEKHDWVGTTIPIMTVIGREKYEDGRRVIESMTRKARQGQMNFDYARTNEQEILGMSPKSKWVVVDGQIDGFDEWADPNRTPYAALRYRRTVPDRYGAEPLDKPERIDYEPPIQGVELAANSAMRDVQNSVGMISIEAKDRVSKSGVAQERIDEAADIASFHFNDNWNLAIEHEARVINEILDKIEDSERAVGTRTEDDKFERHDLKVVETEDGVEHEYGIGDEHDVTLSVGPSFQSQRDAANQFAEKLMDSKDPEVLRTVAWLAVKLRNLGPIGDQLSNALKALRPPAVVAAEGREDDARELPPEAQAQIQAMRQQLQALSGQLDEALQALETKKVEVDSRERIAAMQEQTKQVLKLMDMKIARMKAAADQGRSDAQIDSAEELAAMEQESRLQIQELSQGHEMEKIGASAGIGAANADQAHRNMLEQREMAQRPHGGAD